jgi:hypothetical protein
MEYSISHTFWLPPGAQLRSSSHLPLAFVAQLKQRVQLFAPIVQGGTQQ